MDKDHGAREGAGESHAPSNVVVPQEDDVPDPDEEDLDGLDGFSRSVQRSRRK